MTGGRTIAAAQVISVRGDLSANIQTHLQLAHAAAEQSAQVLVFPELSLAGYELDLAAGLAFAESDSRLDPLLDAAIETEMILVVGAPVRLGPRLHIGVFALCPNGSIVLATKQHLGIFRPEVKPGGPVPPPESSVFEPGDRNPLLEFGTNTATVGICTDIKQPSSARAGADGGAGIYLASMFITPEEVTQDIALVSRYAAAHSVAVAMANYGGPTGGLSSGGRSMICSPTGDILVRVKSNGAGIAVAMEGAAGWHAKAMML